MDNTTKPTPETPQLPTCAIIVDSNKNEETLELCLNSILKQDYSPKLCILVVNNSKKNKDMEVICSYFKELTEDKPAPIEVPNTIYKAVKDQLNFGIIELHKNCWNMEERRKIGIKACLGYSHIFSFLNANQSFFNETVISQSIVKFLEFPQQISMVVGETLNNYYKDSVQNIDKQIVQINKFSDSYTLSKLFYEKFEQKLPSNQNLNQIMQHSVIATLPDIVLNSYIKEKQLINV